MIDVSVVIATRNRRPELMRTLAMLGDLPERPPVLVVDDASSDGTAEAVRALRGVSLLRLDRNHGAVARNFGVREVRTPYVAFSDDDSWWEPGALTEAGRLLDASPRLGLIAARTLVGADRAPDPINDAMAHSPLPEAHGRPSVLGFLACASVLRTEAFRRLGRPGRWPFTVDPVGDHPVSFLRRRRSRAACALQKGAQSRADCSSDPRVGSGLAPVKEAR